jgi:phosphoribosylglycinamide formyltransferase-1
MLEDFKITVIADRSCGALDFSKKNNLERYLVKYTKEDPYILRDILSEVNPDIIITNWNKIIDIGTVKQFYGKIINLHYSLLPAFSGLIGLEPIKKAYEQGCKFIGATCHLVDEGIDTGTILAQAVFSADRPFDESVSIMFRKGCMALLTGINIVLVDSEKLGSYTVYDEFISPRSLLDYRLFEDDFWKEVAEL